MTRLLPLLLAVIALWAWLVVDLADNAAPENPPAEHVVTDHQPDPWATFAEPPAPTVHATSAHHPTVTQQRKRTTAPIGPVADAIRHGFARFGATVAEQAVRVARCESHLNPAATNGQHYGLFQISSRWHANRVARHGYTWPQMLEPTPNIAVAADIYSESGWQPWTCRNAA